MLYFFFFYLSFFQISLAWMKGDSEVQNISANKKEIIGDKR